MATRSFIAEDKAVAGTAPADRVPSSAGRILRYQLSVVATTTEDVLRSAGGWLCDRARAGWDVNVMTADGGDQEALSILGATAMHPADGFLSMIRSSSPIGALAVSADLLAADAGVPDEVLALLNRGLSEVTVWGDRRPAQLGGQVESVQHRVSSAARAFKSHALAAAEVSTGAVTPTETLFRVATGSFRALYSV